MKKLLNLHRLIIKDRNLVYDEEVIFPNYIVALLLCLFE